MTAETTVGTTEEEETSLDETTCSVETMAEETSPSLRGRGWYWRLAPNQLKTLLNEELTQSVEV